MYMQAEMKIGVCLDGISLDWTMYMQGGISDLICADKQIAWKICNGNTDYIHCEKKKVL